MIDVVNTQESEVPVRVISTTPRERWEGHWVRGRKYPLYAVVENNGSKFMSLTGKTKEEPYVIYNDETKMFSAPEGWVIKEMSADSRISSIGGAGGGDTIRYSEQTLTPAQQAQARANLGILDLEYDPVTESIIFPPLATSVYYSPETESIVFS